MKKFLAITATGLFLLLTSSANAQVKYWDGSAQDSLWSTAANWDPNGVPAAGDNVEIKYIANMSTEVVLDQNSTALDHFLLDDMNLTHDRGFDLNADEEIIGEYGYGIVHQTGGTNTVYTNLYQGYNASPIGACVGDYWLDGGGSLLVQGNHLIAWGGGGIGVSGGRGDFYLYDTSTHTVNGDLNLGQGENSDGRYNLIDGTTTVHGSLNVGHDGVGDFSQSSGTNTVDGHIVVGVNATGEGVYNLYGGTLTVDWEEIIGQEGDGYFRQSDGTTHTNSGPAMIGLYSGSYGEYTQEGGNYTIGRNVAIGVEDGSHGEYSLNAGNLSVNTGGLANEVFIGDSGLGYFRQNGGFFDAHDSMIYLGAQPTGIGMYIMTDGQLDASEIAVGESGTGYFLQQGGTVNVINGPLWIARQAYQGTYDLWDGTLNVNNGNDIVVGNLGAGVFNQEGGIVNASGNVVISATPGMSIGEYNLNAGTLNAGTINNNGTFNYAGGQLNANIANSASSILELSGTGTRTIDGDFHNYGTLKVTNTTVNVTGEFRNYNAFISDPAATHFNHLIIEPAGYIQAGVGDQIHVAGNFENKSARNTDWKTFNSQLIFTNGAHAVTLNGHDYGPDEVLGYTDNFSWGDVDFGSGTFSLYALDGSLAALYIGTIAPNSLIIQGGSITNIASLTGENNIYYVGNSNPWLSWGTYSYASGSGKLMPAGVVPEPVSSVLFLLGSGILGANVLRRKKI